MAEDPFGQVRLILPSQIIPTSPLSEGQCPPALKKEAPCSKASSDSELGLHPSEIF